MHDIFALDPDLFQFGIGFRLQPFYLLQTRIVAAGRDQAATEMALPDSIDHDAGRQRIVGSLWRRPE